MVIIYVRSLGLGAEMGIIGPFHRMLMQPGALQKVLWKLPVSFAFNKKKKIKASGLEQASLTDRSGFRS
jgi:hypothetical protein